MSNRLVAAFLSVCLTAAIATPARAGTAGAGKPETVTATPKRSALRFIGRSLKRRAPAETEISMTEIVQKQGGNTALAKRLAQLEITQPKTVGQRVAEKVSSFAGSWGYLVGGLGVIGGWGYMATTGNHFFSTDALNLSISIATWAVGPMLMMYQNRQAKQDRRRQDALLMLLVETERESRHAENQLKTAHTDNRELRTSVANLELKLDKLTTLIEGKPAGSSASQ